MGLTLLEQHPQMRQMRQDQTAPFCVDSLFYLGRARLGGTSMVLVSMVNGDHRVLGITRQRGTLSRCGSL